MTRFVLGLLIGLAIAWGLAIAYGLILLLIGGDQDLGIM